MTMNPSEIYDVLGIGFGPSNIALAVALHDNGYRGRSVFLEAYPDAQWQHGMLLNGSDIQHNPLRDFSTPINPRSEFTFLNYLHEKDKFFYYLNLGLTYAYRTEFAAYVDWVKSRFRSAMVGDRAAEVVAIPGSEPLWQVTGASSKVYHCRNLVVGTGRPAKIPDVPGLRECESVVHLTRYLYSLEGVGLDDSVVVIGSSQSAAEIVLDLLGRGYRKIHLVHRSYSFQLKDTSPFTDEVYFPEFIDYFYQLNEDSRKSLGDEIRRSNYSSVDRDVLEKIYHHVYAESLAGRRPLTIHRNHELVSVEPGEHLHTLKIRERYMGTTAEIPFRLAVLGTGFLDIGRDGIEALPPVLRHLSGTFAWTGDQLHVSRNYAVGFNNASERVAPLYLNGLCEATHGMGDAGSFSLVSLRARDIFSDIAGREPTAGALATAR